ncbi:MAG: SulP family inorganic anion transporter [Anaerolineales bacterium]
MKKISDELKPAALFNSISSGLVVGLIALVNTVTYGVLIYKSTGDTVSGVMLALINGLVLSLLFGLFGSLPGMVAFPQSAMTPVFAGLVVSIMLEMDGQGQRAITATVMAAVLLASLAVGVAYLCLGHRKLGEIIRFMPYPVSGGFLAGLGWVLLKSGMEIGTGKFALETFLNPTVLAAWLPALVFGLLLFILQQKNSLAWLNPLIIIGAIAGFYLFNLPFSSVEELRQAGWLLVIAAPQDAQVLFRYPLLTDFGEIQWGVILQNTGILLTLLFTALIGLLLNINGIEMAVRKDIDPNQEMRLAGAANILTLLAGGGIVGYPSAGLTIVAYKRGQPGRLLSFVVAALFGAALFFGVQYLSYLPNFVIGGLLISLGLNFMYEWLFEGWFKFSLTDFLVVLAIFFTVVFSDLLRGVSLGVVLMVIMFAVNYSKTNVIRTVLTGKNFQSSVDRPIKHAQYLREEGDQLLILRLQGYIFFGTAHSIYEWIKEHLQAKDNRTRYLVIDFTQTYGIDSSAAKVFTKLRFLSQTNQFTLVFVALSDKTLKKFARDGFNLRDPNFRTFETLDYAVEWCESLILSSSVMTIMTSSSLVQDLDTHFNPEEFKALVRYMQRLDVTEGHRLITQGEETPGLYLIDRGRATVYRELGDGRSLRLRTIGAGATVGEIGLYSGGLASASVVTEFSSKIYFLSPEGLKEMESEDPALANKFHRYVIRLLGQRLQNTTASMQALME